MDRLAVHAERALLGAVLLDPAGQQGALDLVEPDDMYRPWHGQVLSAMRRVQTAGQVPGPAEVYAELQNDADLPASVSRDAVPLADLMAVAPRTGDAKAYAVMVAEGGIRRRLELAGSRLAQAAESGNLDAALFQARQARQEVVGCSARWLGIPEHLRREEPAPVGSELAPADRARWAEAVRQELDRLRYEMQAGHRAAAQERLLTIACLLTQLPTGPGPSPRPEADSAPHGGEAEAAGSRALRDLAASPSQLALVRPWLRPAHFARADHGALYTVMRDLHEAGKPVDPVTVAWEAERRGISADPAELADGMGPFAVPSARAVRRLGLLAHAEHAGRSIQAAASDRRCGPGQLLGIAGRRLAALEADAEPEQPAVRDARVIPLARTAEPTPRPGHADREATS